MAAATKDNSTKSMADMIQEQKDHLTDAERKTALRAEQAATRLSLLEGVADVSEEWQHDAGQLVKDVSEVNERLTILKSGLACEIPDSGAIDAAYAGHANVVEKLGEQVQIEIEECAKAAKAVEDATQDLADRQGNFTTKYNDFHGYMVSAKSSIDERATEIKSLAADEPRKAYVLLLQAEESCQTFLAEADINLSAAVPREIDEITGLQEEVLEAANSFAAAQRKRSRSEAAWKHAQDDAVGAILAIAEQSAGSPNQTPVRGKPNQRPAESPQQQTDPESS